jgi:hypothetical protein
MRISRGITEAIGMLIESELATAAAIRAKMDRRLDQVAAQTDLTKRARDRECARAVIVARQEMSALRARSNERESAALAGAYREAFGLLPDRSAEDRDLRAKLAANPPSAVDAYAQMVSALAIGDVLLARAIAQVAYENRLNEMDGEAWVNVLEAYGGSNTELDRQITNVLIFSGQPDKIDRFRDKLQTEIPQPSDLRGDINRLAQDDAPSDARSMGMPWDAAGQGTPA